METSRVPSEDRQAIGQLLVRLLHEFRVELAAPRADLGYGDIREAHMQIFGNIATGDIRLTDLAARAQLSLAATSELVNELVSLGYLDRRPDPTDGRAKLIVLTERGQQLMRDAGQRVAHIEQQWAGIVGAQRFEEACAIMQELLDDHAWARKKTASLVDAKEKFLSGDASKLTEIISLARDLGHFYPRHIEKEDKHFF